MLEQDGKPSHFLILGVQRFATGKWEFDCPGGFIDLNCDGVRSVLERFKKELQEELGLDEILLTKEPILLGNIAPDTGMTNNRPSLFLASIDASNASPLLTARQNGDSHEIAARVMVYPIEKLPEIVARNDDGFFLACVAKGWARGLIPLPPPPSK